MRNSARLFVGSVAVSASARRFARIPGSHAVLAEIGKNNNGPGLMLMDVPSGLRLRTRPARPFRCKNAAALLGALC